MEICAPLPLSRIFPAIQVTLYMFFCSVTISVLLCLWLFLIVSSFNFFIQCKWFAHHHENMKALWIWLLWLLVLIVNLTEFRITWEMGLGACLWGFMLIMSIDMGILILTVRRTVPWAGDAGLYKTERASWAAAAFSLRLLIVGVM